MKNKLAGLSAVEIAVVVAVAITVVLIQDYFVMLLIGSVHSFIPQVPALGYVQVVTLMVLLNMLLTMLKRTSNLD